MILLNKFITRLYLGPPGKFEISFKEGQKFIFYSINGFGYNFNNKKILGITAPHNMYETYAINNFIFILYESRRKFIILNKSIKEFLDKPFRPAMHTKYSFLADDIVAAIREYGA